MPMMRVPLRLYFSASSSSSEDDGSLRIVVLSLPIGCGFCFGGDGERPNGEWLKWCLRVGIGGVPVRAGPGDRWREEGRAGEALREEARAAPIIALERLSPVICFVMAFADSRW